MYVNFAVPKATQLRGKVKARSQFDFGLFKIVYIFTKLLISSKLFTASLVAQTVKRLPTMRETRVPSLSREDPLAKDMATHSSTLAWKIPRTEEPARLQFMGSQRVGDD